MFQPREPLQPQQPYGVSSVGTMLSAERLIDILRQQWPVIAGSAGVVLALVLVYLLTAAPTFTASSKIMMDTRQSRLLRDKDSSESNTLIDPGFVESQVEVLTSDDLILSIVRAMKLDQDPEYVGSGDGIMATIMRGVSFVFGSNGPPSKEQLERTTVEAIQRNLKVERVGVTYVLSISLRSLNAAKSAKLTNALAEAYIVGGLEAKYQSTRRAGEWLLNRSAELREQATEADRAVQTFKSDNNIVGTSRGLMSEQQLTDVNTQLTQARAATAEAKARLDRIDAVSNQDLAQPTVTDALSNNVITRLRSQYLDLASQYADIAGKYGKTHQAAQNLASRMAELRKSVSDEVRRIGDAYRSDYEIAKNREKSVEDNLAGLVSQAGSTSQAQVKLRNLESAADTNRNLYNNFLEKLQQTNQQESFPISDARIISTAVTPDKKSSPKTLIFLIGGTLGGLVIGIGIALAREYLTDVFRTGTEIEDYLGIKCLGTLPAIAGPKAGVPASPRNDQRPLSARSGQASLSHFVVDHPFSRYAETLRNIKVSVDVMRLTKETKIIGIVSSLPKEGKTTVSANLGHLAAMTGHRTLLIDSDLHTTTLTLDLAPDAKTGLIETLMKPENFADHIVRSAETGLDFLPAVIQSRMVNSAEVVASQAMGQLLKMLRGRYEYIFLDLAPLMAVSDAKAISHLIDGMVYVVEWGRTSRNAVIESIASADVIQDKLIGAVLNRADPKMLKRIEAYKGAYYKNYYVEP